MKKYPAGSCCTANDMSFVSFFLLFHQLFVNVWAIVYQVHSNVIVRHDNGHSHMAGVLDGLVR